MAEAVTAPTAGVLMCAVIVSISVEMINPPDEIVAVLAASGENVNPEHTILTGPDGTDSLT